MNRFAKRMVKHGLRQLFEVGQRCGVDVLPRHFYSEIPSVRELKNSDSWRRPLSMSSVNGGDPGCQLQFLESLFPPESRPLCQNTEIHQDACSANGEPGYGAIEALVLHQFVVQNRPVKIVQIGCGVSTAVILRAAESVSYTPQITCIEPFPTNYLTSLNRSGQVEILQSRLQDVVAEIGPLIRAADFLFIDSTHTLGPAGEVTRIIVELLPQVSVNAWVHFHDITFPYDYGRRILNSELFFAHESALLLAFLSMNPHYCLKLSMAQLHYHSQDQLQKRIPCYRPATDADGIEIKPGHFPSSAFLQRVG